MATYTATRKGPQKLYGFYGNGNGATYTITVTPGTGKLNKYDVNRRPIRGGMASVVATGGAGGTPLTYTEPARFDFELEVWADVSTAGTFTVTITSTNSGDNITQANFSDATGTALIKPDGTTVAVGGYAQPLTIYGNQLQKSLAGTARTTIAMIGTSIDAGAYGGGTTTVTNVRQFCLADKLAARLTAAGYPANAENTFGDNNFSGAGTTNVYDPKVTLGAGWSYGGGGTVQQSAGGNWPNNATNANRYSFTPSVPTDSCDFYFLTTTGTGVASMAVNGGTTLGNYDLTIPGGGQVVKVTKTTTLGMNRWEVFKAVGGDTKMIILIGMNCYNSTGAKIDVLNLAVSSATAESLAQNALLYNLLPTLAVISPHLAIIHAEVNNANNASTATYKASLQAIHDAVVQVATTPIGDVIFVNGTQIGTVNGLAYGPIVANMTAQVAATNNRRLVDVWTRWKSFSLKQAAGYFSSGDIIHPVDVGLSDVADAVLPALIP